MSAGAGMPFTRCVSLVMTSVFVPLVSTAEVLSTGCDWVPPTSAPEPGPVAVALLLVVSKIWVPP